MFSIRPKYSDVVAGSSTASRPSLLSFWQSCSELMGRTINCDPEIALLLRGTCRWMRDSVVENKMPWIFGSMDATMPAHILCKYAKSFMMYEDTAGFSLGVLQRHVEHCIQKKQEITRGLESYGSTGTYIFPRGTPEDEERYIRFVNCRCVMNQAIYGFPTNRMQILTSGRSSSRVMRSIGGGVVFENTRLHANGIFSTSLSVMRAHPRSHAVLLAYAELLNCIGSMPGCDIMCSAFKHRVCEDLFNGLMCHQDSKPLFVSISKVIFHCVKVPLCNCCITGHQALIRHSFGSELFQFYYATLKREDVFDVEILGHTLNLLCEIVSCFGKFITKVRVPETCRVLLVKLEHLMREAGADDSHEGVHESVWVFLESIAGWGRFDRNALIEFFGDHKAKLKETITASMRRYADNAVIQDKGRTLLIALPK
jgi:hypothetical protein